MIRDVNCTITLHNIDDVEETIKKLKEVLDKECNSNYKCTLNLIVEPKRVLKEW